MLVEAFHQAPGTELHDVVAGGRITHPLAAAAALEVDHHVVAGSGGALHGLEAGRLLAQPLDLGVDRLLVDLGLLPDHVQARVLAQLRLRPELDRGGERQVALLGHLLELDLGIGDR